MSRLSRFTETKNSDNRYMFTDQDNSEEIIIGGTCKHVFKLPFTYSKFVKSMHAYYKQGLDIVLDVEDEQMSIDDISEPGNTIVTITLNPAQTFLFTDSILNTFVQLRIINTNNEVIFDEPHFLTVKEPLEY